MGKHTTLSMGTYIPYTYQPCGNNIYCKGGTDCHPDLAHPEVEGAAWKFGLAECCHWSLHNAFEAVLREMGPRVTPKPVCRYGVDCVRTNPYHLWQYSHGAREPIIHP